MAGTYEVYALNQAGRTVDWSLRLYSYTPGETAKSAYFLWVLQGPAGPIVVDTGFAPHQAAAQGVALEDFRTREALLAAAGVDPASVSTVILTHLHWDHFDVEGMFPQATFWVQRRELEFWTGYGTRERWHRRGVTDCFAADVAALQSSGRLRLVDGTADVTDGVALEWVGGHTPGLQIVRGAHRERRVRARQRRADDVPKSSGLDAAGRAPQQHRGVPRRHGPDPDARGRG